MTGVGIEAYAPVRSTTINADQRGTRMAYVSASIITLTPVPPNFYQPCVKINRGIWVACKDFNATFTIHYTYAYMVGGSPRATSDSENVSAMTLVTHLDGMWSRARGKRTQLSGAPDHGSQIQCTVQIKIVDASQAVITQCDSDTYSQNVP